MHQTTVRFGADLWDALEQECARLGVSVAQYLREAALARLVYAAGKRGDGEFELALELATGSPSPEPGDARAELAAPPGRSARAAQQRAFREWSESAALVPQGDLARARSRTRRQRAEAEQAQRKLTRTELGRAKRSR
jgi:hypothetical protein